MKKALAEGNDASWLDAMRAPAFNYIELALLYKQFGFNADAIRILKACPTEYPMLDYLTGYLSEDSTPWLQKAESLPVDGCNPNRLEELAALQYAVDRLPSAPHAHYYLGNLYYDKKQYTQAIAHWEAALEQQPNFAMCLRNLSIAAYNKQRDARHAIELIDKACAIMPGYPRFWLERDQLAGKTTRPVAERFAVLQAHREQVDQRDDLTLRYIALCNCLGDYRAALSLLQSRNFHPWEGGEGKVSAQYRIALTELAKAALREREPLQSIDLLKQTLTYPPNLGEGKLPSTSDHQAYYFMGLAYRALGNELSARQCFTLAAQGEYTPESVLYYNDQPSDYIFYQGLAHRALKQESEACKAFSPFD